MSKCPKKHYPNKSLAKRAIKIAKASGQKENIRAYKCTFCDGFHISKCTAKEVRKIREFNNYKTRYCSNEGL